MQQMPHRLGLQYRSDVPGWTTVEPTSDSVGNLMRYRKKIIAARGQWLTGFYEFRPEKQVAWQRFWELDPAVMSAREWRFARVYDDKTVAAERIPFTPWQLFRLAIAVFTSLVTRWTAVMMILFIVIYFFVLPEDIALWVKRLLTLGVVGCLGIALFRRFPEPVVMIGKTIGWTHNPTFQQWWNSIDARREIALWTAERSKPEQNLAKDYLAAHGPAELVRLRWALLLDNWLAARGAYERKTTPRGCRTIGEPLWVIDIYETDLKNERHWRKEMKFEICRPDAVDTLFDEFETAFDKYIERKTPVYTTFLDIMTKYSLDLYHSKNPLAFIHARNHIDDWNGSRSSTAGRI